MKPLNQKLIDRKIFQYGLLYSGFIWALVEIFDFFIDRFDYPESWIKIVAIVGFSTIPLALIFIYKFSSLLTSNQPTEPKMPSVEIPENSIAVMPFENMSDDPDQEYLSDGISEEIINMLSQASGLKVSGRTSSFVFKGKGLDSKTLGNQLGVSHILEGSVRKSGNQLRITTQLVKCTDGFNIYSEKFDKTLENIFAIQDEVSLAILDAIKLKLLGNEKDVVFKKETENVEAYDLYLKGRFHVNKFSPDDFLKAIEYFDAAIDIDPDYAMAYSAKAFCYMNLADFNWLPAEKSKAPALESAAKSLELDDKIADSHIAVGRIKLHWEWKVKEALEQFRIAIKINPNSAECHVQIGFCLAWLGQHEEAKAHANKAESLDPLSVLNLWYISAIPFAAGDFEKVLSNGLRLITLAPNFFSGYMIAGWGLSGLKRYDEAIKKYEKMVELAPGTYSMGFLGQAYGLSGDKPKAKNVIEKMKSIEGAEISGNHSIGLVYGAVGEWDNAFKYLNKAVDNREGPVLWAKYFSRYTPEFIKDPRSKGLLDRIGYKI